MKYGAMNFPVLPVVDEIESFAEMGFDYLELTLDPPKAHYSTIRKEKKRILKSLAGHSMGIVCHLPTFVYTADLADGIRKASVDEILRSLETAADLNASKAVLHPGLPTGMGVHVPRTVKKLAFESIGIIVERAAELGVRLCLENMFPRFGMFYDPVHFEEIFQLFPDLKMTLDVGHANIHDPRGKRTLAFIERLGDRIGHLHISDNMGKRDDHIPVGHGTAKFEKIVRALKNAGYRDTATFEIFGEDRNFLMLSRKKFDNMMAG